MVALLSSTTPIMLLPLLWIYTKQCPNPYAWLGLSLPLEAPAKWCLKRDLDQ